MVPKAWSMGQWKPNMNEGEKKAYDATKAAGLQKAVAAVKAGKGLPGIQIKLGDHTLTLRPSGVSEKGSVAYSYPPTVIQYEGRKVRLNKISFSLLSETDGTGIDWDNLAVSSPGE